MKIHYKKTASIIGENNPSQGYQSDRLQKYYIIYNIIKTQYFQGCHSYWILIHVNKNKINYTIFAFE